MENATDQLEAQARDIAVALLKQGRSAAEVWEALLSIGVEGTAAEALVRELVQLREAVEGSPAPAGNASSPLVVRYGNDRDDGWVQVKTGSYGTGFALGFCLGCWALVVSVLFGDSMGTETKRGLYAGFATGVGVAIVVAMFAVIAGGR